MTNETKEPAPRGVAERRTHPRYGFTADAEVIEGGSGASIKARIADISERGCNAESDQPFSLGTAVKVQITKDRESFVAPARVVYASPHADSPPWPSPTSAMKICRRGLRLFRLSTSAMRLPG